MSYIDEDLPALAPDAVWRTDKRLQRDMAEGSVAGSVIKTFYTIGALAAALGKEPGTIRRWVQLGVIPESPYVTPPVPNTLQEKGLRLWKEEQIVLIVVVAHECGLLGPRSRAQSFKNNHFESILKQRWVAQGWPLV